MNSKDMIALSGDSLSLSLFFLFLCFSHSLSISSLVNSHLTRVGSSNEQEFAMWSIYWCLVSVRACPR